MSALCHATGFDIRSSINTLQFAALRCKSKMSAKNYLVSDLSHVISSMISSGLKDETKDIFQIWREIFCKKELMNTVSRKFKLLTYNKSDHFADQSTELIDASVYRNSYSNNLNQKQYLQECVKEIMSTITEYNDNALVNIGIFEHYLKVRYNDPTMYKTQSASDWLSFGDYIEGLAIRSESGLGYSGGFHTPTVAAAIFLKCSIEDKTKIEWPMKVNLIIIMIILLS